MRCHWLIRSLRTRKQKTMSAYEQLNEIKANIYKTQDPAILFAMNQRVRQLEDEIKRIEQIKVVL